MNTRGGKMMNRILRIIAVSSLMLLFSGCMGTFETARVVPFKAGVTYFTTFDSDEDDSFGLPGIAVETGWPAGPARFGIGLHLRATAVIGADDGFMTVWGGKVQMPLNSLADFAIGLDVWGIFPGEIKLLVSRRFGIVEPYASLGVAGFIDVDDDDEGSIDIFSDDGLMSFTLGTMVELGRESGWVLAAEIEAGDVWESPGVGLGFIRVF